MNVKRWTPMMALAATTLVVTGCGTNAETPKTRSQAAAPQVQAEQPSRSTVVDVPVAPAEAGDGHDKYGFDEDGFNEKGFNKYCYDNAGADPKGHSLQQNLVDHIVPSEMYSPKLCGFTGPAWDAKRKQARDDTHQLSEADRKECDDFGADTSDAECDAFLKWSRGEE